MHVLLSLRVNKHLMNWIELYVTTFTQSIYNYRIYLKKIMFRGIQCCSYSVFTIYSTRNVTSHVECFVLLLRTSCRMCAVPNVAVLCSSLFWYFSGMFLGYVLNDSEMAPVASVIILSCLLLQSTCADLLF